MEKPSNLVVSSPNLKYTDDFIYSDYSYEDTLVTKTGSSLVVSKLKEEIGLIFVAHILSLCRGSPVPALLIYSYWL